MSAGQMVFEWLDVLWLPVTYYAVSKRQRITAGVFVIACIFILRLQVELMEEVGFPTGMLPFSDGHVYGRGLIVYAFFIMLFFGISRFSRGVSDILYMAEAFSVFVFAFCAAMLFMLL